MSGKYNSPQDEFVHLATLDGWSARDDGDVTAPTGFFSRISIGADDVDRARTTFAEHFPGEDVPVALGHFLVLEDEQGFVTVQTFSSADDADKAFEALESQYGAYAAD